MIDAALRKSASEALAAAAGTPFEYGRSDCCLFAADLVLTLFGTDYAAQIRGAYRCERGALQLIAREGGLQKLVSRLVGVEPLPVDASRFGDFVMMDFRPVPAVGMALDRIAVFRSPDGVVTHQLDDCLCCWEVPCRP